jgi:hypothetical protein
MAAAGTSLQLYFTEWPNPIDVMGASTCYVRFTCLRGYVRLTWSRVVHICLRLGGEGVCKTKE